MEAETALGARLPGAAAGWSTEEPHCLPFLGSAVCRLLSTSPYAGTVYCKEEALAVAVHVVCTAVLGDCVGGGATAQPPTLDSPEQYIPPEDVLPSGWDDYLERDAWGRVPGLAHWFRYLTPRGEGVLVHLLHGARGAWCFVRAPPRPAHAVQLGYAGVVEDCAVPDAHEMGRHWWRPLDAPLATVGLYDALGPALAGAAPGHAPSSMAQWMAGGEQGGREDAPPAGAARPPLHAPVKGLSSLLRADVPAR